ncbi:MAG: sugar kinase [Actinobacteria bacterium]|nr:sugar kinase [Actinomycetota bacterium]MBU1494732.1 sugar kinase [Actinomycetota bacterium]
MQPTGVFVGAATLDLHYLLPTAPPPNTKGPAQRFGLYAGGPATNAAVAFAHLGGRARLYTEVGSHPLGAVIADDVGRLGVEMIDMIGGTDAVPMVSAIITTGDTGDRTVVASHYPNEGMSTGFDGEIPAGAGILLVDGFLMAAAVEAARLASDSGIPVVLDAGSWKPGMDDLLAHIDIAICAADFQPPGTTGCEEAIDHLFGRGITRVAVTGGGQPIRYRDGESTGEVPIEAVPVVDTLGAGDILHGAFCYYLAAGSSFADALGAAAEVATASTRSFGTRAWMHPAG